MTDEWIPQVDLEHNRDLWANIVQRIATVGQAADFIDGPEVEQFEDRWADYVGARYCVAVGNGTDALELAVRGVWGAQEIGGLYIPAMTFVATAEAVVRAGENVALTDVDLVTLLASEVDIAVGLYGQAIETEAAVVDAAQMHGHRLPGLTASWSFYPTKNLGAWGDAGAVTTDDEGLAEGIREWARHGGGGRAGPGFNSRLDTIQACVLIEKISFLDQWVEERRQAAESYQRRLRAMNIDVIGTRETSVFHQCVVRIPHRDRVLRLMLGHHVECGVHYPRSLSEMDWLRGFRSEYNACPVAERAAREVLSLPLWPGIPVSTIDRVVNALGESVEQAIRTGDLR